MAWHNGSFPSSFTNKMNTFYHHPCEPQHSQIGHRSVCSIAFLLPWSLVLDFSVLKRSVKRCLIKTRISMPVDLSDNLKWDFRSSHLAQSMHSTSRAIGWSHLTVIHTNVSILHYHTLPGLLNCKMEHLQFVCVLALVHRCIRNYSHSPVSE